MEIGGILVPQSPVLGARCGKKGNKEALFHNLSQCSKMRRYKSLKKSSGCGKIYQEPKLGNILIEIKYENLGKFCERKFRQFHL